ncbi:hypothetical protein [Baaleninema sp.]|uniref:hypothetical protein n=1 Tax=Baaleninema sp. TaxID=3101197 RepID=UPI003D067967
MSPVLKSVLAWLFAEKNRTYDYRRFSADSDYIFEPSEDGKLACITSTRGLPKPGDLLLLPAGDGSVCYRILQLETYGDSPDLWTAQLERVVEGA